LYDTILACFKSFDLLTLFFVCSDLHQNGCQFNMSRNVSYYLSPLLILLTLLVLVSRV
jgi:hypothetical protein